MSQEPPFDRPFDPPDVGVPDEYDDLDLIFDLGPDGGGEVGDRESDDDDHAEFDRLHGLAGVESLDDVRRFIDRTLDTVPGDVVPSMIELEKIPRRLWEQTLAPLHPQQRIWAARHVPDRQLRDLAFKLAFALDTADHRRQNERAVARGRARRSGAPVPTPTADHATRRSSVQVNMRVRGDDHERLKQAAEAVGCKPTTLARSLVLNGVAMILQDHALQR